VPQTAPAALVPSGVWAVDIQFDAGAGPTSWPITICSILDEHARECPRGIWIAGSCPDRLTSQPNALAPGPAGPLCCAAIGSRGGFASQAVSQGHALIDDADWFDRVTVIGVDEHLSRHTRRECQIARGSGRSC
jgi:hypothetical protein